MRTLFPVFCALFLLSSGPAHAANQLRAASADASTFLRSNWNKYTENYHPNYVLDGNPKTARVEGASGQGEGEKLTVPLSALSSARSLTLRVRNGYQKTKWHFEANSAPKTVKVRLVNAAGAVLAEQTHVLTHTMGWQGVVVNVPHARGFSAVQLEIVDVYPGNKYKDTCISDVEVHVDSDVPWNEAVENAKHKRLEAWITERVATAKYFASKPVDYPFIAHSFDNDDSKLTAEAFNAQVAPHVANMAGLSASPTWHSAAYQRRLSKLPDGAWNLGPFKDLLELSSVSFFESDKALGKHTKNDVEEWSSVETWVSNHKIAWADDAHTRPSAVYFTHKNVVEERGTYTTDARYLITYDPQGRASTVYAEAATEDEMGPGVQRDLYVFQRGAKGRIASWTHARHQTWSEIPEGEDMHDMMESSTMRPAESK